MTVVVFLLLCTEKRTGRPALHFFCQVLVWSPEELHKSMKFAGKQHSMHSAHVLAGEGGKRNEAFRPITATVNMQHCSQQTHKNETAFW